MEILGLEKVSLVDYGGYVCATIFTGGCNFICPFCHNASLVKRNATTIEEKEVLDYLKSRTKLLDAVTISGGEPTLQKDLKLFIKKVKEIGYKVKLDTNGTNPTVLKELLEENIIDYVAMDIKNNFDDYAAITGLKVNLSDRVKQSLDILKKSNINYELRTTLVDEYHNKENIIKLAKDLSGEKILYLQKFVDSGDLIGYELNPVSKSQALEFQKILSENIEKVVLRGYS